MKQRLRTVTEHFHQFGIHEGIIIGNPEAPDRGPFIKVRELLAQALRVFAFHGEHQICPSQIAGGDPAAGFGADAGTADFDTRVVALERFAGGAAPLVFAADEKQFQADGRCHAGEAGTSDWRSAALAEIAAKATPRNIRGSGSMHYCLPNR